MKEVQKNEFASTETNIPTVRLQEQCHCSRTKLSCSIKKGTSNCHRSTRQPGEWWVPVLLRVSCMYSAESYTNKAQLRTEVGITHGLFLSLYSCLWRLRWHVGMFEGTSVTKTK